MVGTLLKALLVLLATLAVLALVAGRLGWLSGQPPDDLGVRAGRLKGLSNTDNCVSSQAALYPTHPMHAKAEIAPLPLQGSAANTIDRLAATVAAMPGARVVQRQPDYLYAQFTTPLMRFVDDVEFWVDPQARVVQVRSASRVGRRDFGVNRQRVEAIRAALARAG